MKDQFSWKNASVVTQYLNGTRGAIPFAADQIHVMLYLLKHNKKPVKTFVDLGAGGGILSRILLENFKNARGYLIDFSEPMLEAAHKAFAHRQGQVEIINSDISAASWQDRIFNDKFKSVDFIVSGYCIHHLTHERKYELYKEIYNRLSPGGMFINLEHVASQTSWGERVSDELFIDSIMQFNKKTGKNRPREEVSREFHNREDKKDNKLLLPETQCSWLREIGFKEVDVYFKSFELAVFAGIKN